MTGRLTHRRRTFRRAAAIAAMAGLAAVPLAAVRRAAAQSSAVAQSSAATGPAAPAAATHPSSTLPATLAAADTRPSTNAAEVDALIVRLADPDWRKREKARAELVRLGDAAVPALRRAAATAPQDEARTAAAAALTEIAEDRVVGPSYVTLKLTNVSARRAFEELGRQSFAPLKPYPENLWTDAMAQAKVTVELDRQPFWVAMRELGRQTGVEIRDINGEPRLVQTGGGQGGGRAAVAGAFLVTANQLTRSQTVDLAAAGDPPVQDDFGIHLTASAEPKVRVLAVAPAVKLEIADDDHGNSLLPPAPPPNQAEDAAGTVYAGEGNYSLFATLKYPATNPGKRIARLRGSAVFAVQVASEKVDVPVKQLAATTRTVKDVRVTFGELTKVGDGWQLKVTAGTPEAGPAWQEIQASLIPRLRVLDAAGQPLDQHGFETDGDATSVKLTLTFGPSHRPEDGRQSGEPVRLAWEIPTRTREVTVPFEFKDLKLP